MDQLGAVIFVGGEATGLRGWRYFAKWHSGSGGYHHEVFHDDEHVIEIATPQD
jgi:hypothetical protein